MVKVIYIGAGFLCVALGAAGVFLPVLPTTPFLLLAVFCFSRGSKRYHDWFLTTNLYKKHLKPFAESRSMTRKSKIGILSFASSMLLLTFIGVDHLAVRLLVIAVAATMYVYFFTQIKTIG